MANDEFDLYAKEQLENFGERLKSLRKKAGYTSFEKFCYDHNFSRSQYGTYEQGKDLRFSSLLKVLKALGISPKDFFSEGFE